MLGSLQDLVKTTKKKIEKEQNMQPRRLNQPSLRAQLVQLEEKLEELLTKENDYKNVKKYLDEFADWLQKKIDLIATFKSVDEKEKMICADFFKSVKEEVGQVFLNEKNTQVVYASFFAEKNGGCIERVDKQTQTKDEVKQPHFLANFCPII